MGKSKDARAGNQHTDCKKGWDNAANPRVSFPASISEPDITINYDGLAQSGQTRFTLWSRRLEEPTTIPMMEHRCVPVFDQGISPE